MGTTYHGKDGGGKESAHIVIAGVERPVELVEISAGCTYHSASFCTLMRLLDTGERLHLPGRIMTIEQTEMSAASEPETKAEAKLEFPPATIDKWIRGGYVVTERLVQELRDWLEHFDR